MNDNRIHELEKRIEALEMATKITVYKPHNSRYETERYMMGFEPWPKAEIDLKEVVLQLTTDAGFVLEYVPPMAAKSSSVLVNNKS
jgi:hypothetical protein